MKRVINVLSVLTLLVLVTSVNSLFSQSVGIGGSSFTPDGSAMLEIQATGQGLLIPRMTWATRPASPVASLLIYLTDGDGTNGKGYYYWDGAAWVKLFSGTMGWGLTGNSGTTVGTNFIGTTDNTSLSFKTNSAERMRITNAGYVGIGTTNPVVMLDVALDDATNNIIGNVIALDKYTSATPQTTMGSGLLFRCEDFAGDIENVARIAGIITNTGAATEAGALAFYTRTGGGVLLERARINASGNFGIGTNNPQVKLDVQNAGATILRVKPSSSGDAHIIADKYADGGINSFALFSNAVDIWRIGTAGDNHLRITYAPGNTVLFINTSEKVGIGTTTPGSQKLFVQQTGTAGSDYGTSTVNAIYAEGAGAQYSFGVTGFRNGTSVRSGGVHGALSTAEWGALGYYSSGSVEYGGYFTTTTTGSGFMPNSTLQGIGSASSGNLMGSWSRGELFGQTNMGELYAAYNLGNQYTSGVSADIVTSNGERTAAYSVTSNDVKVYSDGKAKLTSGSCKVTFDKSFMQLLSQQQNPTITVSALGECEGLYIVSFDKDGFTVKEFHNGQANVEFTWIAIGKRVDADKVNKLPEAIKDKDFDKNMKGVMFNENNKEKSGMPIWWDGSKLRFDKAPVRNIEVKKGN
jgi:hypothetical protein